jgi:uncharacterized protein (DUF885 family)
VDTGLHYKNMTRQQAFDKFKEFAWATGDVVSKEVVRYQSGPGQATSYMIGQQELVRLREYAEKELGSQFKLKDFHYQILSQGGAPLSYYKNMITKYVSCVKKPTKSDDCNFAAVSEPKPSVKRTVSRKDFINLRKIKPILR